MRPRVIAPNRVPSLAIHDRVHAVAQRQRLFQHRLVRAHALHRQHAPFNLRNSRIPIRRGKPPSIAHLPARVSVEARMIEHDFNRIARPSRRHAHSILHNGYNFAVCGAQLAIALKRGLRQIAKDRASRLLASALP